MAETASSSRRVSAAGTARSSTSKKISARGTTVPSPEDLDLVKDDALLQLRIGRSAHYYAVIVAIVLLADAFLVLVLQPVISAAEPTRLRNLAFVVPPLFAGLFLAAFGLRVKWEVYQLWPWEPHFSVTVAAVLLDFALVAVFVANIAQVGPVASWNLLPWYFPLALLAVALPLLGMIFTWPTWSSWKTVSTGAAVIPVGLALAAFVPAAAVPNGLALTLSSSAVLFLVAGSFVHITSSGTRAHEREIITSGQSRLFQIADELREKEQALHFRESTLLEREANVENAELGMGRKVEAQEEARRHISALEADVQARSESVVQQQRDLAIQSAETTALAKTLEDRATSLSLREADLTARLPKVSDREQALSTREGELARREADVVQRETESKQRLAGIPETEQQLDARQKDLDARSEQLLQKESALQSRAAGWATDDARSTDLATREAKLAQLKVVLDEQNVGLGRKAREVKETLAQMQSLAQENSRKAEELALRERSIGDRERTAAEKSELAERSAAQYAEALHLHEERVRAIETREADLKNKNSDLQRVAAALTEKDRSVRSDADRVQGQRLDLEQREKALTVRTKTLDAREAEVSLKGQAIDRRSVAPPTAKPSEVSAADTPLLVPTTRRKYADRIGSGTARLDDLLLGGFPQNSHIALIGDAFVGKEVAMYSFLAEGLRKGEPVIVVTASRPPEEVGQKIGLVLPQLHEYEQLGKVHWVDAATPAETPASGPSTATQTRTRGPTDFAGILSALVQRAKAIETSGAKSFRVAYFGLSSSLTAADEKGRLGFLQNLVAILKPRSAVALYALETGSLPENQTETILSRMDGVVRFKQERDKTFFSVLGLGEVQTHDWVEYRTTPRGLVVGSFALERIR